MNLSPSSSPCDMTSPTLAQIAPGKNEKRLLSRLLFFRMWHGTLTPDLCPFSRPARFVNSSHHHAKFIFAKDFRTLFYATVAGGETYNPSCKNGKLLVVKSCLLPPSLSALVLLPILLAEHTKTEVPPPLFLTAFFGFSACGYTGVGGGRTPPYFFFVGQG